MHVRFAFGATILLATTLASAEPPPPTFVQMPNLGVIDPNTGTLRSFDSGKQPVGTSSFYKEWFYQFNLDASQGATLRGSIEQGAGFAATIEVQDAGHRTLGPLAGPLPKLGTGTYYIHVTSGGPTQFHFGVIAVPPLRDFPNDAGHTKDTALNLGNLTGTLGHQNSFYTYFQRQQLAPDATATGPLIPDFNNPQPYAPAPDWYRFTVPAAASVKLSIPVVESPGETYVLVTADGLSTVWGKNQSQVLQAGMYWLMVLDRVSQVIASGGGSLGFVRNSQYENFEKYQFQLITAPSGQPGNNPATVDLTASITSVNTNLGMGGSPSNVTVSGGTVIITYRIANNGAPETSAGHVAFYISQTPQLTPASKFIVYASLFDTVPAMGATPELTTNLTLPNLPPGQYYVIVVANYDKTVNETNFNNNASGPWMVVIR